MTKKKGSRFSASGEKKRFAGARGAEALPGRSFCVAAMIADKIPANFAGGSSSGGQTKTYTYTNSMGCETTVVSDNGRDFYDPCPHEYMGSSSDGGQTIVPK